MHETCAKCERCEYLIVSSLTQRSVQETLFYRKMIPAGVHDSSLKFLQAVLVGLALFFKCGWFSLVYIPEWSKVQRMVTGAKLSTFRGELLKAVCDKRADVVAKSSGF